MQEPIIVRIFDDLNSPQSNVPIYFKVIEGGGTVSDASILSDENGYAEVYWTMGDTTINKLEVEAKKADGTGLLLSPHTFTAEAEVEQDSISPLDSLLAVTLPDGQIIYAHPTDNSSAISWGDTSIVFGVPTLFSIGAANQDYNGAGNTANIVGQFGGYRGGNYAAKICDNLVAFSFDDWYLPAAGELKQMYNQLGPIAVGGTGEIVGGNYWSSSQHSKLSAWVQFFVFGTSASEQWYPIKNAYYFNCRCVRRE